MVLRVELVGPCFHIVRNVAFPGYKSHNTRTLPDRTMSIPAVGGMT